MSGPLGQPEAGDGGEDLVVGIVVVSHSRALARAAVALAQEMTPDRAIPIAIAAGLDEETLGTDAMAISEAMTEVAGQCGEAGLLILMDLGSAVLSAEMALEFVDDEVRERALLCSAPIVEGLIAAVVTAAGGAPREEVAAEARNGLLGKQSQIADTEPPEQGPAPQPTATTPAAEPASATSTTATASPPTPSPTARFVVAGAHGLHARPAARLVAELRNIASIVEIRNATTDSGWVRATSLSRIATLGVLGGHEVEVRAEGADAGEAVGRLKSLAERNFDEPLPSLEPVAGTGPRHGPGPDPGPGESGTGPGTSGGGPLPASPGIVVGPVRQGKPFPGLSSADVADVPHGGSDVENRSLTAALDAVRRHVTALRDRIRREASAEEAAIFDAHLALLEDPAMVEEARERIGRGEPAARAWAGVAEETARRFEALDDEYLAARGADVRAIGEQVLAELLAAGAPYLTNVTDLTNVTSGMSGSGEGRTVGPEEEPGSAAGPVRASGSPGQEGGSGGGGPAVFVVPNLTPAQAVSLDANTTIGVVMAFGSPSGHAAILVRARGIPALVGAGAEVLDLADGTTVALDGTTGELVVDPSPQVREAFEQRADRARELAAVALRSTHQPAVTRDGQTILVAANASTPAEVTAARGRGADAIGLVRTEFLFLDRDSAPDVDEQESAYLDLADAFGGERITLRTLDVGGDKPLGYLPMPAEDNPFLGLRGLRLGLSRRELLTDQLRAIVRVARQNPVSVMFPMVSTLGELLTARRLLADVIGAEGTPIGLRVGIMVEVPAAALKAAALARHVDFFSIGTNDLTQYTLAAERGNDAVAALGDPFDPAVLALIKATCDGAAVGGAEVAVCGEFAADVRATGLLAGLGVRELSVTPRAVPQIKQTVRDTSLAEARELAAEALASASAEQVRELLPTRS